MNNFEIRVLLRHYWKKGLSARAAAVEICELEDEGTIGKTAAIKWFKWFDDGDFDFKDKPSSSIRDLADEFGVCQKTIVDSLNEFGFVHKKPRQDPHELTEVQAMRLVEVCHQLLNNPLDDRSRSWVPRDQSPSPVVRQDHFGKKIMLCVWWNLDGVVHLELIPDGRAVNAKLYTKQLERVYNVLKRRYPTLIHQKRALLQYDNASAHRANLTKEKLDELDGIEVLPHPAYSPDLAPSNYGLFRSMVHFFRGRRFETFDQFETACREFFEFKEPQWYRDQIQQLAERWRKVIENDGLYFEV